MRSLLWEVPRSHADVDLSTVDTIAIGVTHPWASLVDGGVELLLEFTPPGIGFLLAVAPKHGDEIMWVDAIRDVVEERALIVPPPAFLGATVGQPNQIDSHGKESRRVMDRAIRIIAATVVLIVAGAIRAILGIGVV